LARFPRPVQGFANLAAPFEGILTGTLDHNEVDVAVGVAVAASGRAEKDDLVQAHLREKGGHSRKLAGNPAPAARGRDSR